MSHSSKVLHPVEQYLVDVVTDVARTDLGIDFGPWCRRDARDDSGLRVDLTFEASNIALELTSLQDGDWNAAGSEAIRLGEELTTFVRERHLPGWIVGVSSGAHLRTLASELKPLMEAGIEIQPMSYSSTELANANAAGELKEFVQRHRRLHALGLSLLHRSTEIDCVSFIIAGAGFRIVGFSDQLARAVADNVAKLEEARPRETHLAVLVHRWDLSEVPSETAPPPLPPEVDALWVVHPARSSPEAIVWFARRGDVDWQLMASVQEPTRA